MIRMDEGSSLSFEELLAANVSVSHPSTSSILPSDSRTRFSLNNVRLSFNETDVANLRHGRGDTVVPAGSTNKNVNIGSERQPSSQGNLLSKYDKLMLSQLFSRDKFLVDQTCPPVTAKDPVHFTGTPAANPVNADKSTSRPAVNYRVRTSSSANGEDADEFLLIQDNVVLRGKGLDAKYRVVQEIYTEDSPVVDAVWCTFIHHDRVVKPEHATITPSLEPFAPVETVCVAEQRKIHVHRMNGENYAHSSSFPIKKLWKYPLGLLVERDIRVASNLSSVTGYPNLFTAAGHLEELAPVLFIGGGNADNIHSLSLLLHPESSVAGTADDVPLVLIFEPHKNAHSLWLARFTTAEEIDRACVLLAKEQWDGGEGLHFHPSLETSRLGSRRDVTYHGDSTSNLVVTAVSPSVIGMKPPSATNLSSRKNTTLHKEVLLSASGKFPYPDSSPSISSGERSSVRPLRFSSPASSIKLPFPTPIKNTAPTEKTPSVSSAKPSPISTSSAVIPVDMSFSINRSFSTSLIPISTPHVIRRNSSPNISAHALKDLRSSDESFGYSKVLSMISSTSQHDQPHSGPALRRHSKSTSASINKKSSRTAHYLPQPTHIITDELAHPKVSFVHLWTDSSSGSRQTSACDAFLITDCLHQKFFCFVLPMQQVLRCIPVTSHDDLTTHLTTVSVGSVSNISAISAVKVGELMVILEPNKTLRIYSGPDYPLQHIDHSASNLEIPSSPQHGPSTSSPQLTNNVWTIQSPHFSPVLTVGATPPLLSPSVGNIQKLVPCAGNKFIIETNDGPKLHRIPSRPSSDVIDICMDLLRSQLSQELFGKMYVEIMKLSFLAKSTVLRLSDRWDILFTGILVGTGYSVRHTTSAVADQHHSKWDKMRFHTPNGKNLAKKFSVELNAEPNQAEELLISAHRNSPLLRSILLCLHLVSEDAKLCDVWQEERQLMVQWLLLLAILCKAPDYVEYYQKQLEQVKIEPSNVKLKFTDTRLPSEKLLPLPVPNLIGSIDATTRFRPLQYPFIKSSGLISRSMIVLVAAVFSPTNSSSKKILDLLKDDTLTLDDFALMPSSLRVAFQHRFNKLCEEFSFETLPSIVYEIANRTDAIMCRQAINGLGLRDFNKTEIQRRSLTIKVETPDNAKKKSTPLPHSLITRRFANDARIREAEKLLVTSEPVIIPLNSMQASNEVEFRKSQESWLKTVAPRTMSLPVARGMLSLRTEYAYATEKLTAPEMVYSGLERGTGRKVSVKNDELPSGHDFWPRFHNGVATGLRLRRYDKDVVRFDQHWLAFNAAQYTKREAVEYAGIFFGMALNGMVDVMTDPLEMHNMLIRLEESVSIAVILGMACVNRGTQDKRYLRMISLHMVSLIEDPSVELVIPQSMYVASLLSLGLLYRASANRFISERLLAEIWNGTQPESDSGSPPSSAERESASLSAAVGLGFVLLGLGNESVLGLADLEIPQRLRMFMVGGMPGKPVSNPRRTDGIPSTTFQPYRSQRDDDQSINTHITAPGAILALALIYMKTERQDIADWMDMPQTLQELDDIRPDFLLLRVTARSLIMWNSVDATEKWVSSNFPPWILKSVFSHTGEMEKQGLDVVSITQAYFFILAGCCMSIGLKFAGTASVRAKTLLMTVALMMTKWAEDVSLIKRCSQSLTQTCLTTILIALASVMAGTGDLEVFRLLRYMHGRSGGPRNSITYGHQMGVHMAIGLLFLSCGMYTLGTSNEALAAMLTAFYPMWPKNPSDNRYHLQAFRHLYVLAVENRLVMSRSIYGSHPVQANVKITFKDSSKHPSVSPNEMCLTTPCVLPELSSLKKVAVESGSYWLNFTGDDDWDQLKSLLSNGGLVVYPNRGKQKKDELLHKMTDPGSVLVHMDRFMSRPVDTQQILSESMRKFVMEQSVLCPNKGISAIFDMTSRKWLKKEKQWIPWVLYECISRGCPEAFFEILTLSKENDANLANVCLRIMKFGATERTDSQSKWKRRLCECYTKEFSFCSL